MKGIRLPNDNIPTSPGEYSLGRRINGEEYWMVIPPKEGLSVGTLINNKVEIHEDGTITYDGIITYNANHPELPQWKGTLIKGIWYESN